MSSFLLKLVESPALGLKPVTDNLVREIRLALGAKDEEQNG